MADSEINSQELIAKNIKEQEEEFERKYCEATGEEHPDSHKLLHDLLAKRLQIVGGKQYFDSANYNIELCKDKNCSNFGNTLITKDLRDHAKAVKDSDCPKTNIYNSLKIPTVCAELCYTVGEKSPPIPRLSPKGRRLSSSSGSSLADSLGVDSLRHLQSGASSLCGKESFLTPKKSDASNKDIEEHATPAETKDSKNSDSENITPPANLNCPTIITNSVHSPVSPNSHLNVAHLHMMHHNQTHGYGTPHHSGQQSPLNFSGWHHSHHNFNSMGPSSQSSISSNHSHQSHSDLSASHHQQPPHSPLSPSTLTTSPHGHARCHSHHGSGGHGHHSHAHGYYAHHHAYGGSHHLGGHHNYFHHGHHGHHGHHMSPLHINTEYSKPVRRLSSTSSCGEPSPLAQEGMIHVAFKRPPIPGIETEAYHGDAIQVSLHSPHSPCALSTRGRSPSASHFCGLSETGNSARNSPINTDVMMTASHDGDHLSIEASSRHENRRDSFPIKEEEIEQAKSKSEEGEKEGERNGKGSLDDDLECLARTHTLTKEDETHLDDEDHHEDCDGECD